MYVVAQPFAGLLEGSPVYPSPSDAEKLLARGLIKLVEEEKEIPVNEEVPKAKRGRKKAEEAKEQL